MDVGEVLPKEIHLEGLEHSPVGIAIIRGSDFVVTMANEFYLQIMGRSDSTAIGRPYFDLLPETRAVVEPLFRQALDQEAPYHGGHLELQAVYERHGKLESGYFNLVCHALKTLTGKNEGQDRTVWGILVTLYDVTQKVIDRKRTEENEERLRIVLEASGLGTWELNLQTGEFSYSNEYLATFGISERLSHGELLEFIHQEDRAVREQAFKEALVTGWLHYTSRLIWRDNSTHWIEAHGKMLYDDAGKPLKMIGASRDITAETLSRRSLEESEEKFRLLASSMPQFIWTGDANGKLNYFNQAVYEYTGLPYEALKGQGWIQIVHPEDRAASIKRWLEAVRKGSNFLFEHRFRRHDGTFRWQLTRAMPQYDSQGRLQMWVGTSTDIHEQKTFAKDLEEKVFERTRQLKETNEILEKTNRELEQFAYIASHDLQEPLRKIQTFADILKKNIHDEATADKYFSKIDSSAQRMGDLIRSVLDYSRLPAHPGQLRLTDLNEIYENVRNDLELMIADKNAVVECGWLPAVPGIPLQLQQLFSNLIGNALKFCRDTSPSINISARAVPGHELTSMFNADETKQYVQLQFRDNGIGFDNRYKEQIFTIFQRLHGWQQYSGTGIGLALCKKIVDGHQGYITADSTPGRGSTFKVYLPA